MSGYKRFVSYMYRYVQNEKRDNVGYARIENFKDECKITIHMKDVKKQDREADVYLFHRNQDKLEGIFLDKITIKNGVGEFQKAINSKKIVNSSYEFSDISGIIIHVTKERFWGTEWDGQFIDISQFQILNEIKEEQKEQNERRELEEHKERREQEAQKKLNKQEESKEQREDKELRELRELREQEALIDRREQDERRELNKQEESKEQRKDKELREQNRRRKLKERKEKNEQSEQIGQEELKEQDGLEQREDKEIKKEAEQEQLIFAANVNETDIQKLEGQFFSFNRIYPLIDEHAECISVEPNNLSNIHEGWKQWEKNDFLLHGYGRFRHILVGRKPKEKEYEYFLGIPGIYRDEEERIANTYGFMQFIPRGKENAQYGDFGYWCTNVTI